MPRSPHAAIAEAVSQQVLRALEDKEAELDEQIQDLESKDADELERLRDRRLRQLKAEKDRRDVLLQRGHGTYQETTQSDFRQVVTESYFVVAHFWRPSTRRCEIVDKHLGLLARKHVNTRFVKINAERALALCDRLNITIIPTILLIRKRKAAHMLIGFEELGRTDDFPTAALEKILERHKLIGCPIPEKDDEVVSSEDEGDA